MSRKYYQQFQALRDVTEEAFASGGQIRFVIDPDSSLGFIPSKSFFKIRCRLSAGTQAAPRGCMLGDGVAPNYLAGDSLFQQLEVKINDICVSKQDDFVHQIAALRTRMTKSKQWLDTTGESTNYTHATINKKIHNFVWDGHIDENGPNLSHSEFPVIGPQGQIVTNNQVGVKALVGDEANQVGAEDPAGLYEIDQAGGAALSIPYYPGQVFHDITDANTNNGQYKIIDVMDLRNDPNPQVLLKIRPPGNVTALANYQFIVNTLTTNGGEGLYEYEILWTPCLGFFQKNKIMPAGRYEIILTPHPSSVYKKRAVECVTKKPTLSEVNIETIGYDFKVLNLEFYGAMVQQRVAGGNQVLEIEKIRCQAATINTNSLTQKNFVVHPNTHALTLAYQDNWSGEANNAISRGRFILRQNRHLNLQRFYIQHRGITLPTPQPDLNVLTPEQDVQVIAANYFGSQLRKTDFFKQRYHESDLYASSGYTYGAKESYLDWINRGPYYHFFWPKTNDKSTEVIVSQQWRQQFMVSQNFSGTNSNGLITIPEERPQLLLFDHYMCSFSLTIENGRIKKVTPHEGN